MEQFLPHFDVAVVQVFRAVPTDCYRAATEVDLSQAPLDEEGRRRFRRYWLLIGPFSSFIRRMVLRLVATELDRAAPDGAAGRG